MSSGHPRDRAGENGEAEVHVASGGRRRLVIRGKPSLRLTSFGWNAGLGEGEGYSWLVVAQMTLDILFCAMLCLLLQPLRVRGEGKGVAVGEELVSSFLSWAHGQEEKSW